MVYNRVLSKRWSSFGSKVDPMVGGCEADEAEWFYQPRNFSLGHRFTVLLLLRFG
jgi:hypothetical protein